MRRHIAFDYIRFRTEPDKRVVELEQMITRPDPGPDFKQHLWDYVMLVSEGEQAEDLSDWIKTFYTDRTYEHPLASLVPLRRRTPNMRSSGSARKNPRRG